MMGKKKKKKKRIRLGKEFLSADFCLRKERREASYKPDVSLESILEESI